MLGPLLAQHAVTIAHVAPPEAVEVNMSVGESVRARRDAPRTMCRAGPATLVKDVGGAPRASPPPPQLHQSRAGVAPQWPTETLTTRPKNGFPLLSPQLLFLSNSSGSPVVSVRVTVC